MGAGDWLMATAQVRSLNEATGKPVVVIGVDKRPQWHEVFENNPRILRHPSPFIDFVRLLNGPNARPYIEQKLRDRWLWKHWPIAPGEVYLSRAERNTFGQRFDTSGYVLIEPHTKVEGSNKAWLWDRWQAVANSGVARFVQVGPRGTRRLNSVHFVETTTFRQAMTILSNCIGFLGTEGGLHHAAAALHKPAVVLFSEFISPDITGYREHHNIRHAGATCGSRRPCDGCRTSMASISVAEVLSYVELLLKENT